MSNARWGDDDSDDSEEDDAIVILPSAAAVAQTVGASTHAESGLELETPRMSNVQPKQQQQRAWSDARRGGGRGSQQHHQQQQQQHQHQSRGHHNHNQHQHQQHNSHSNNQQRQQKFQSDWKAQAKRDSILSSNVDVEREAGNWMATRRAKQEAARAAQQQQDREQQQKQQEQKQQQRKSQLQALKAAVSTLQQQQEHDVGQQQQRQQQQQQQHSHQHPHARTQKGTTILQRGGGSGRGGRGTGDPPTRNPQQPPGEKWERTPLRGGVGGRGRGRGSGGRASHPRAANNNNNAGSSLRDAVQLTAGGTATIQTESGQTVEYRLEQQHQHQHGDASGSVSPVTTKSSLQTRAERLPNGGVRITRQPQRSHHHNDDDSATAASNDDTKSTASGAGHNKNNPRGGKKKKKPGRGHDEGRGSGNDRRGGGRGGGSGGGRSGGGGGRSSPEGGRGGGRGGRGSGGRGGGGRNNSSGGGRGGRGSGGGGGRNNKHQHSAETAAATSIAAASVLYPQQQQKHPRNLVIETHREIGTERSESPSMASLSGVVADARRAIYARLEANREEKQRVEQLSPRRSRSLFGKGRGADATGGSSSLAAAAAQASNEAAASSLAAAQTAEPGGPQQHQPPPQPSRSQRPSSLQRPLSQRSISSAVSPPPVESQRLANLQKSSSQRSISSAVSPPPQAALESQPRSSLKAAAVTHRSRLQKPSRQRSIPSSSLSPTPSLESQQRSSASTLLVAAGVLPAANSKPQQQPRTSSLRAAESKSIGSEQSKLQRPSNLRAVSSGTEATSISTASSSSSAQPVRTSSLAVATSAAAAAEAEVSSVVVTPTKKKPFGRLLMSSAARRNAPLTHDIEAELEGQPARPPSKEEVRERFTLLAATAEASPSSRDLGSPDTAPSQGTAPSASGGTRTPPAPSHATASTGGARTPPFSPASPSQSLASRRGTILSASKLPGYERTTSGRSIVAMSSRKDSAPDLAATRNGVGSSESVSPPPPVPSTSPLPTYRSLQHRHGPIAAKGGGSAFQPVTGKVPSGDHSPLQATRRTPLTSDQNNTNSRIPGHHRSKSKASSFKSIDADVKLSPKTLTKSSSSAKPVGHRRKPSSLMGDALDSVTNSSSAITSKPRGRSSLSVAAAQPAESRPKDEVYSSSLAILREAGLQPTGERKNATNRAAGIMDDSAPESGLKANASEFRPNGLSDLRVLATSKSLGNASDTTKKLSNLVDATAQVQPATAKSVVPKKSSLPPRESPVQERPDYTAAKDLGVSSSRSGSPGPSSLASAVLRDPGFSRIGSERKKISSLAAAVKDPRAASPLTLAKQQEADGNVQNAPSQNSSAEQAEQPTKQTSLQQASSLSAAAAPVQTSTEHISLQPSSAQKTAVGTVNHRQPSSGRTTSSLAAAAATPRPDPPKSSVTLSVARGSRRGTAAQPSSATTSQKSSLSAFSQPFVPPVQGPQPTDGLPPKGSATNSQPLDELPVKTSSLARASDDPPTSEMHYMPQKLSSLAAAQESKRSTSEPDGMYLQSSPAHRSVVSASQGDQFSAVPTTRISSLAAAVLDNSKKDEEKRPIKFDLLAVSVPNEEPKPEPSLPDQMGGNKPPRSPLSKRPPPPPPPPPKSKNQGRRGKVTQTSSAKDNGSGPTSVCEAYVSSVGETQPPPPPPPDGQKKAKKVRGPAARAPYKGKRVLNRPARAHASRVEIG